jgi:hypothetical protein
MKKYMLLFLCFTQFMAFGNNGNEWADFLCSKTTEQQKEENLQKKSVKTDHEERNKKSSNNNFEELQQECAKVTTPNNLTSGSIIGIIFIGSTIGLALTAAGIAIHTRTR